MDASFELGQSFHAERTITGEDVECLGEMLAGTGSTGGAPDGKGVARTLVIGKVSQVLGGAFPGPGTVVVSIEVRFERPVPLPAALQIEMAVTQRCRHGQMRTGVTVRSGGETLMTGDVLLVPPSMESGAQE